MSIHEEQARFEERPTSGVIRWMPSGFAAPFTLADAEAAAESWGCNCGPAALAAVLGLGLDEVRPHISDFERKGYTNPTLMFASLRSLGAKWYERGRPHGVRGSLSIVPESQDDWPELGLCRVQWEGPWTEPDVPIRARYRHTHWIASRHNGAEVDIFDINAVCSGGWIAEAEWRTQLVPWLLKECQPRANGRWHLTHRLEIIPPNIREGR